MNSENTIIALSPGDILIQIVPEFLEYKTEMISLPDLSVGYLVPLKKLYIDQIDKEFCGVAEVCSIYINTKINRDLLEELYNNTTHFDLYIRQRNNNCPKVIRIYNDCTMYRQEFSVPEIGLTTSVKYYFTNSNDPWEIPDEKLQQLVPENQYYYDYAVSKAIKNLQKSVEELPITLPITIEQKINRTIQEAMS
jgi:hypothetical protein